jgi:hypothetical protein
MNHRYPPIVPCPKCGRTDTVHAWQAWGHPNGELVCDACTDPDVVTAYWTWHMDDGVPVIQVWARVSGPGGGL